MLARLGLNRAFFLNPVTWIAVVLLVVAVSSAVQADRHYSYTCSLTAPIHLSQINNDEYFVGIYDTMAYQACKGRIPERFKNIWPLADCSPGGRARWSSGELAGFPQKCRRDTGNYFQF